MAFFNQQRKTIQCDDCPLLLQSDSIPCSHCEEFRQVLNRLLYCLKMKVDRTACDSHTNYQCLTPSEKDRRMNRLHLQSRITKQQIFCLTGRVEKLIETRGAAVDDDLGGQCSKGAHC